ncbi:hypothetical protein [Streptomyces sp. SCSIO ZS0520]|uniref:hypothetical protein n=1 Tax=Streptomyces sp. SCSIO ZS0520 TaxID=2892996 RepID=UPI0021DB682A|nr:hypothetical protein [Streptomyces sp. SCSIO ZS0520]
MRTRAAAASAALILSTVLGTAACSSSADSSPSSTNPTSAEKKSHDGPAASEPPVDPAKCATTLAKMPKGCEADADFAETEEAAPATGTPSRK